MKQKLLICVLLALGATTFGQGQINLDNNVNTSTSPTASANGLFFQCVFTGTGWSPINQDFNVSFYGGSDANSLVLLRTFAGPTAVGDNAFGPGTFTDPSGVAATVPGATTMAFFRIDAWLGNAPDFGSSIGLKGSSGVFSNPVAMPPNTPPDFMNMPAVLLGPPGLCPEPGSLVLIVLGAATALVYRRWGRQGRIL